MIFAKIENGVVTQVIVCSKQFIKKYSGTWIETFVKKNNNPKRFFAGIGYNYDSVKKEFYLPKPFPSWVKTTDNDWKPPKEKPKGSYRWNELRLDWEEIPADSLL